MDEEYEIVKEWHEVPVETVNKRTQIGQTVALGLKHGWEVKLAKTVVRTKDRTLKNGKLKKGSVDEYLWVGGAKPDFEKPKKVFLANKFYFKKNMRDCNFTELKQFILEN